MLIKSFFYSFISYKVPYHLTSIHLLCESVIFFTTQICPSQPGQQDSTKSEEMRYTGSNCTFKNLNKHKISG